MASFFESALTLITLASLFIVGPAVGHAIVTCFNWQNWSVPVQHLIVGLCTMLAVSGMILLYGFVWAKNPNVVAWYGWIEEPTIGGRAPGLPAESRQKSKAH